MATQAVAKSLAPTPKLPELATKSFTYMNVSSAASSEFFKNATKPEWRTESRPVDLSDEQPAIFKRYCQWLYTGFIAPGLLAESSSGCLAYMYVLGEKIVDHEFQNAVIQAIISDMGRKNKVPSLGTIKIIYDGTTEGSAARRLLVDSWAHDIISSWKAKKDLLEDAYRPFLNDLFLAVVEKRLSSPLPENEPWILQPHPYHREAAVLKSDVAEQKDGEMNSELVGRDQMDISEA